MHALLEANLKIRKHFRFIHLREFFLQILPGFNDVMLIKGNFYHHKPRRELIQNFHAKK